MKPATILALMRPNNRRHFLIYRNGRRDRRRNRMAANLAPNFLARVLEPTIKPRRHLRDNRSSFGEGAFNGRGKILRTIMIERKYRSRGISADKRCSRHVFQISIVESTGFLGSKVTTEVTTSRSHLRGTRATTQASRSIR